MEIGRFGGTKTSAYEKTVARADRSNKFNVAAHLYEIRLRNKCFAGAAHADIEAHAVYHVNKIRAPGTAPADPRNQQIRVAGIIAYFKSLLLVGKAQHLAPFGAVVIEADTDAGQGAVAGIGVFPFFVDTVNQLVGARV